jgi:DNA helicase IV
MRLPAYQELSREQDKINNLPLDASYLIVGPPGTGKTVMALYRASMLCKRKTHVHLLMHSRLLSQYTDRAIQELGLDGVVSTFHNWFGTFYRSNYRRYPPQVTRYVFDWMQILEKVNTHPPAESSIAHLIIDEGQDMAKEFYLVARHVSRHFTVFADDNQRLYDQNATIEDIQTYSGLSKVHTLTRNYRNTVEIAQLAAHFYTGLPSGIPDLPDRSGPPPVMLRHDSLRETVDFIARFERNNPDLEIGVFVPTTRLRNKFFNRLRGKVTNPVQAYEGGQGAEAERLHFDRPGVKVVCYQSAKGLEFDAVFIPELQDCYLEPARPDFQMTFYVLVSRAREHLFLGYSGDGDPAILRAFPRELLEWR